MTSDSNLNLLNAIVIGCGRIGGGTPESWIGDSVFTHAAAYQSHSGFHIVACVEPDADRRDLFMRHWKVDNGFASLAECLAAGTSFDVASVCTPTPQHAADLHALLKTNARAVWCEKPITGSSEESAEIVGAYKCAGKHLAVNHLRRWHPAITELKNQFAEGEWGAVHAVVGFYTKGVRNNGSHLIDLIGFLFGPVHSFGPVLARIDYDPHDPTIDALLHTDNGTPVHLIGGDARSYALFELEIIAATGSVRIEQSGRTIRTRRTIDDPYSARYRILNEGKIDIVGTGDAFFRAADNIYKAITHGEPLVSDGETALDAERICDALLVQSIA